MSDKFQNKYRIASARAQWWDYGWNGAYFITICTPNREHFFGEIINGEMKLSRLGVIADILWHEIPNHAKFAELGDFVVMPNHVHGILILEKPDGGIDNGGADTGTDSDTDTDVATITTITTTIGRPTGQIAKIKQSADHWSKTISEYWQKHGFVHHWIIQIGRYQTCQQVRINKWLANPVSRPYHP